mgnify:CR=1 FL=1
MPARDLTDIVKAYDIRGLVPDELDAAAARALGIAFAEVVAAPQGATRVAIGRDMRASSPALSGAFAGGVSAAGLEAVDIGLASTDGLYFASGHLGVPGAMFTASHNPARYNGIKLTRAGAQPVGRDTGLEDVRRRAAELLAGAAEPARAPGARSETDVLAAYGGFLRSLVDLAGIRPLRVVVDAGNGMAGYTVPAVLEDRVGLPLLPLTIIPLYFDLDGTFPNHEANPLDPANLVDLQAAVRAHGADLGLAFDGDADRCFVVDEHGDPVSPSAITALVAVREIAREVAAGTPAAQVNVVHNVITSAVVPEVIRAHGAVPVRTRVGHSFIKAEMARADAVFGGEHSAHYYFRDFWYADTGMLAALHVLAELGGQDQPLSVLVRDLSPYAASGEINSTVADVGRATEAVRDWAAARGLATEELDGLTVIGAATEGEPMWWFNLRPSNTEPLLRLNVEAAEVPTMTRVRDEILSIVRTPNEPEPPVADSPIAPWVRALLVCPACHGALRDLTGERGLELACTGECGRIYPVTDGIPTMLVDQARLPDDRA